jgi:hypothetical protein
MFKHLLATLLMSVAVSSAFADDAKRGEVQQTIELKNGATVYVFKDGKMAMEDKFGRAVSMKKNVVMETKDGKKIIMHGNEVMRLDSLNQQGHN